MNLIKLRITTPKGTFYDEDVEILTLKTTEGYIGIQYNHVPFISTIEISTLYINKMNSSNTKIAAIGGGLVFVDRKYIDIFTDDIKWKEDLDQKDLENSIEKIKKEISNPHINEINKEKNELKLKKLSNQLATLTK